ncbi:hypothetical protein V6N13_065448 [Hibiscus sabdariffa]
MIAEVKVGNEDLNLCFEKLMMVAAGNTVCKGVKMNGVWITEWKDIPVELLLRIVSLLNDRTAIGASGVCSGWRDAICGVCSGWRDAICFGLARLRLSCCRKNMNSLVLSLAPKFTKLQTLILRQDNPQLEDEAVLTISKFCHDLQDLDLSKSFKLSDCSLYALAHGCPNLKRLNISGCTSFSDEALAYLTDFCRKLKLLNLCGCVNSATGHALQAIGRNCNMLQSLNLGWYYNVGDHGVMSLAYGCPDLRCLDMCGCVCITDDSVIALANECGGRSGCTIAVTSRTGRSVQALCDSFPALHTCSGRHSLVMSGCLNLTPVHCACAAYRTFNSIYHAAH